MSDLNKILPVLFLFWSVFLLLVFRLFSWGVFPPFCCCCCCLQDHYLDPPKPAQYIRTKLELQEVGESSASPQSRVTVFLTTLYSSLNISSMRHITFGPVQLSQRAASRGCGPPWYQSTVSGELWGHFSLATGQISLAGIK